MTIETTGYLLLILWTCFKTAICFILLQFQMKITFTKCVLPKKSKLISHWFHAFFLLLAFRCWIFFLFLIYAMLIFIFDFFRIGIWQICLLLTGGCQNGFVFVFKAVQKFVHLKFSRMLHGGATISWYAGGEFCRKKGSREKIFHGQILVLSDIR